MHNDTVDTAEEKILGLRDQIHHVKSKDSYPQRMCVGVCLVFLGQFPNLHPFSLHNVDVDSTPQLLCNGPRPPGVVAEAPL